MKRNLLFCIVALLLADSIAISAQEIKMAGFEEKKLSAESSWSGDEEWTEKDTYTWKSGSYDFEIFVWTEFDFWSGFAISNESSTEATDYKGQFRSSVGKAYEGENYAVCYPQGQYIRMTTPAETGEVVSGFYITSTAWTKYAILNGDGMSSDGGKPFAKGDWLKITVKGYLKEEQVSSLDYYLADYRSENEKDHYIVDSWQWLDLTSLGNIDAVTFVMDGSKRNDYGVTTPIYFCLDNFNGEQAVKALPTKTVALNCAEISIPMTDMFDIENDGSTVTYAIIEKIASENIDCNVEGDALVVEHDGSDKDATLTLVISATQKGKTQYVSQNIKVSEFVDAMAGFEEKKLPAESSWSVDSSYIETGIYQWASGLYLFDIKCNIEWQSWSGFAISNETSTESTGNFSEQYRSAAGGAYEGENYAVCYPYGESLRTSFYSDEIAPVAGFYITTSAWSKYAILNGDGFSDDGGKPFGKGDWFKVTADGYIKGEKVASADFYLADYRAEKEIDRYIVDTWQWFDLRSLGSVDEIQFSLSGTKKNEWGLSTPAYFCMDNFNGKRAAKEQSFSQPMGKSEIALSQYFDLDNDGSTIVCEIVESEYSDAEKISCELENDILKVDIKSETARANLVVSATQKGKTQYLAVTVLPKEDVSVNTPVAERFEVYPVPANDYINIQTSADDYTADIITVDGRVVKSHSAAQGNSITLSDLNSGIYILRLTTSEGVAVKQIVKK